jgi:hypothetical protein
MLDAQHTSAASACDIDRPEFPGERYPVKITEPRQPPMTSAPRSHPAGRARF